LPGNILLAPMSGYTDSAFRSMCVSWGADLCFSEMASAVALARGSRNTLRLLDRAPNDRFIGFQVFASEPASAAKAVREISPQKPSLIDLNCGCSVPRVLKTGCGAALLRNPKRIWEILTAMRQETDIPLTVKLRSGWDEDEISYLAAAEAAVNAGARMVCLHPRTRAQGFAGCARWEDIAELKRQSPVPVLGSGDLFRAADCLSMLERTGCDGVMVARGALGNPFIFRQVKSLARGEPEEQITPAVRLHTALTHLRLLVGTKGEKTACREMRKHFVAYTKGMEGGAAIRQSVVRAESLSRYERIVEDYLGSRGWGDDDRCGGLTPA
jgi:tRNA-dihydrouridine synthase B